jgi:hypothetical protein
MSLPIILTDAGRAAIASGQPLIVDAVIFGSGAYTPLPNQTVMQSPIKTITTVSGTPTSPDTISVTIKDTSIDAYTVNEIGLRLSTGVLFAVMSQPGGGLLIKTSLSWLMATFDAQFVGLDVSHVSFGDASFAYPKATEAQVKIGQSAKELVGPESMYFLVKRQKMRFFGLI